MSSQVTLTCFPQNMYKWHIKIKVVIMRNNYSSVHLKGAIFKIGRHFTHFSHFILKHFKNVKSVKKQQC